MKMEKFTIVIPVYGNEKNLPVTIPYIMNHLDLFPQYTVDAVLVCDGSPDASWKIMKEFKKRYPETLKIINLERNYGQKMAITCGLEFAKGDVIGVISADLQDPFELFADMLQYWQQGYQLIAGKREQREDQGVGKYFSQLYHQMVKACIDSRYPLGGFDLFLVDGKCVQEYLHRIMRYTHMQLLLVACAQKRHFIGYKRKQRELGKSGYSFCRKMNIALVTFVLNTDWVFRQLMLAGKILSLVNITACILFAETGAETLHILLCGMLVLMSILIFGAGLLGCHMYRDFEKMAGSEIAGEQKEN